MSSRLDAVQLQLDELGDALAILSADPAARGQLMNTKAERENPLDLHVVLVLQTNLPLALVSVERSHVLDRAQSFVVELERRHSSYGASGQLC